MSSDDEFVVHIENAVTKATVDTKMKVKNLAGMEEMTITRRAKVWTNGKNMAV